MVRRKRTPLVDNLGIFDETHPVFPPRETRDREWRGSISSRSTARRTTNSEPSNPAPGRRGAPTSASLASDERSGSWLGLGGSPRANPAPGSRRRTGPGRVRGWWDRRSPCAHLALHRVGRLFHVGAPDHGRRLVCVSGGRCPTRRVASSRILKFGCNFDRTNARQRARRRAHCNDMNLSLGHERVDADEETAGVHVRRIPSNSKSATWHTRPPRSAYDAPGGSSTTPAESAGYCVAPEATSALR